MLALLSCANVLGLSYAISIAYSATICKADCDKVRKNAITCADVKEYRMGRSAGFALEQHITRVFRNRSSNEV